MLYRLLLTSLLFIVVGLDAQTTPRPILVLAIDAQGRLASFPIGSTMAIVNGKLEAVLPIPLPPKRIVGVSLTRKAATNDWLLPADYTAALEVFINGLYAEPGTDFVLDSSSGTVRLTATWDADTRVRVNYESGQTTVQLR